MKTLFLLAVAILCVGCAVTREDAATIATREVARRKLPLPKNYALEVHRGDALYPGRQPYTIWMVTLSVPNRKNPLYELYIDQRNGAIVQFWDSRAVSISN